MGEIWIFDISTTNPHILSKLSVKGCGKIKGLTYDPLYKRMTVIEEEGIIHTLDIVTQNKEENKEEDKAVIIST